MATDVSVVIADYATANSWANGTQYLTVQLDENVTATVTGGGNSGKYYTKGNEWRIYQTENPTLKIATTSGTLSSIKVTYNVTNTGTLKDGETNIASATSVAVSGTEKTFSVGNTESATTNGQVKITKIEVSYSAGAPASVATPTFTPAPGTYHSAQNVTIACATEGAEIHYTLDGTDPLSTDKKYTEPIVLGVDGDYTIKAIAIKGDDKSAVATADYTIAFPKSYSFFDDLVADASAVGKLVSVTFANIKLTGVYVNSQEKFHGVYINAQDNDDNDLEIYCKLVEVPAEWGLGGTISGTIVGTWKEYNGQWEVEIDDWSGVTTYVAPAVEAPRMTPLSESFFSELDVTLTCATDGAKIYYTLDKSAPTAESAEYTAPIKLNASTAIRAIAIKGDDKSEIAYKQYTMGTTLTCADAKEKALSVAENNKYYNDGEVFAVEGYVTKIQTAWSSKKISFWIDDKKGTTTTIEAYQCAVEKKEDAPAVGDKVRVIGKLTKYNTTPEVAAGCTCVILEKETPAVNLGPKTIAEFLALKNLKDTCELTGTVSNIVMDKDDNTKYNKYGNFDLTDATGTVYVYGLLNSAGESGKFIEMGINAGTKITVKAVYYEYVKDEVVTPQAMNALLVAVLTGTGIENTAAEVKAIKYFENGQLIIEKNGVKYNAQGAIVK